MPSPLHRLFCFCAVGALALGLTACDSTEDNIEFRPGDARTVVGSSSPAIKPKIAFSRDTTATATDTTVAINNVEITYPAVTAPYYIQAFTIQQNHSWSVEGPGNPTGQTRRDGEYFDVTFGERGSYAVKVNDGTYAGTKTVKVTTPPAIDACIAKPYRIIAGDEVTFDGVVASQLPATVSVDYGEDGPDADDKVDTATNVTLPVTRTYSNAGTFDVVLTAKNDDGSSSCTIPVEVLAPVTVSGCTATPQTVRLGQAITFDGTVEGVMDPTVVSIAYGNGVVNPNAMLPEQYTYGAIGTYTATITGTNPRGSSSCAVDVEVVQ